MVIKKRCSCRWVRLLQLFFICSLASLYAESKEELRIGFLDLKFGMLIHDNMGTYLNKEWVEPGQEPATFNPTKLDIGQWADAAVSAGMKYAVLTAKHHDGFRFRPMC